MEKNYIGTAKKIKEFKINIIAENEEEALEILDNIVSVNGLISSDVNSIIDLSVEEKTEKNIEENYSHSNENKINLCEDCEFYCPVCNSCLIDE